MNYKPVVPQNKTIETSVYQKSGLRAFLTVICPIIFLIAIMSFATYILMAEYDSKLFHFFLCLLPLFLYLIYTYWERMYFLKIKDETFVIKNLLGRKSRVFNYSETMKVAFGSSLGKGAFLYLEILDKNYKYYQFPLDMLPKGRIKEIIKIFKEKGVDATDECW